MRRLLAEDLLLLLTDDDTGKPAASGTEVDLALGGALLVELVLSSRVDVAGPGEPVREGRLVVRDPGPTGDPLLDHALSVVAQKEGKKPENAVAPLGKHVRAQLYDRLVEGGVLRAEDDRILGIFPRHRWPAEDAAHESTLRDTLVAALRDGASVPDERTGALVSLLVALGVVTKVVDPASLGLSKKELKANAMRLAEGDWAAGAVRRAVDEVNAAVVVALTSGAVIAGTSGAG